MVSKEKIKQVVDIIHMVDPIIIDAILNNDGELYIDGEFMGCVYMGGKSKDQLVKMERDINKITKNITYKELLTSLPANEAKVYKYAVTEVNAW